MWFLLDIFLISVKIFSSYCIERMGEVTIHVKEKEIRVSISWKWNLQDQIAVFSQNLASMACKK